MWLHSSVGRAKHRQRGGHGFESRWSPDLFFQASSFQLLKLENLLRWSFFTFWYYIIRKYHFSLAVSITTGFRREVRFVHYLLTSLALIGREKNLRANMRFYIRRCLYSYFYLKGLIRLKISVLEFFIFLGLSHFFTNIVFFFFKEHLTANVYITFAAYVTR